MHAIAAKAVCFNECLKPEWRIYSEQVVKNSRALADAMIQRGYKILTGGTDNHLFLIDLRGNLPDLTARKAQEILDLSHITLNKNTVPYETRSPFQASGIRIGTPAVTTRGLLENNMIEIADMIHTVLSYIGTNNEASVIAETKIRAAEMMRRFPLPYLL